MALQLIKELTDSGVEGDYNRITQWIVDADSSVVTWKVSVYRNKNARETGKNPIDGMDAQFADKFEDIAELDISTDPRPALYTHMRVKKGYEEALDV